MTTATTTKKSKKGRARKGNRYGLDREYISKIEREFARILPRAGEDKEQAELLRHMRSTFGLKG